MPSRRPGEYHATSRAAPAPPASSQPGGRQPFRQEICFQQEICVRRLCHTPLSLAACLPFGLRIHTAGSSASRQWMISIGCERRYHHRVLFSSVLSGRTQQLRQRHVDAIQHVRNSQRPLLQVHRRAHVQPPAHRPVDLPPVQPHALSVCSHCSSSGFRLQPL